MQTMFEALDAEFDALFASPDSDEILRSFGGVEQVAYEERVFETAPEQDARDSDWSMV